MVQGPLVNQKPVPSHNGAGPYRHNSVTPVETVDQERGQRKEMRFCCTLLFRAGNFVGKPALKFLATRSIISQPILSRDRRQAGRAFLSKACRDSAGAI